MSAKVNPADPPQSNGLEKDRLKFARLIALLCFLYFFTRLGLAAFGVELSSDDQILIAVVGALGIVSSWAFGSSIGSAVKQADQQKILDKVVK